MPVAGFLQSRSIAQKVVFMVVTGLVCLSVVLLVPEDIKLQRYAETVAAERVASGMRVAWTVLESYGTTYEVKGGKLYAGTQALTGFSEAVDRIKTLAGATATIFQGDTRVATNVVKSDGTRAVGTQLDPGPVDDRVLKSGQPFRGEANILGHAYFTAYDPIKDATGRVIGILYVGIPQAEILGPIDAMRRENLLLALMATVAAVMVCVHLARRMFDPLIALRTAADRLSSGDFKAEVPFGNRADDLGGLARALITLRESSREKIRIETTAAEERRARELEQRTEAAARLSASEAQLAVVLQLAAGLERLSAGDLTYRIDKPFPHEYEKLRHDFNRAMQAITETLAAISVDGEAVASGSRELAAGVSDLSARTETQAASLEETAASMEQMAAAVKQNSDNTRVANSLGAAARSEAERGSEVVRAAMQAMSEINAASRKISDIIGTIDEIAFQTNLLALNAAVEAARAGEQGRGFAVVASEVRNLAGRSAMAAKEIKDLILTSNSKVSEGHELVTRSGVALDEIMQSVKKVSDINIEIAVAGKQQSAGIDQVNKTVMQLDGVTQQNAALLEESAASARSIAEQSTDLLRRIAFFRLTTVAQAAFATTPAEHPRSRATSLASVRRA
jgi:methyl-accepting chemotaxis protein